MCQAARCLANKQNAGARMHLKNWFWAERQTLADIALTGLGNDRIKRVNHADQWV